LFCFVFFSVDSKILVSQRLGVIKMKIVAKIVVRRNFALEGS